MVDLKKPVNKLKNQTRRVTKTIKKDKYHGPTLCTECETIPFNDYLANSSSSSTSSQGSSPTNSSGYSTFNSIEKPQTHCFNLENVLSNRSFCRFCQLLFHSICRSEYDLLKAEHIRKHLHSSEKLKDVETFEQWAKSFSFFENLTEGEDVWPFGYSRDQKEAQKDAESVATELFQSAEERDLNSGALDGMYDTTDDLVNVLQLASGVAGIAGLADPGRFAASAQLVSSQMAMFGIGKAKRLPCLFIIRAYGRNEAKAGVLSVRVFAHGRGFHSPLKEICHFSFRLEQPDPRPQGQQIWYGRTLRPRIDVPFFEQCLVSCQQLHRDACDEFHWRSHSSSERFDDTFPFRLINVEKMSIVRRDFKRVLQRPTDPEHLSYVALSYTWGSSPWTEHIDNEGRIYYYNTLTRESTYSHHIRLRRSNIVSLSKPGSLARSNIYIPQTIQDAIAVCKSMNERYLWVDSLCVVQDEGDPDKATNIAHMDQIYGEAVFTIVAGDAQNADAGMMGISTDRVLPKELTESHEILENLKLFLPVDLKQKFDPWESRAWTLQEKLLSRRMLVIASGYAVWRCRGAIWREDVNALDGKSESAAFPWQHLKPAEKSEDDVKESGLRTSEKDESIRLFRSHAFYQYVKVVEDFSGRIISEPWKIMDAFEGLQRVLESQNLLNSSFRFGLPVRFIDAALLWQPIGPTCRRRNKEDPNGNVLLLSPPSWSWAGWEATKADSDGGKVGFETPFEVLADEKGLLMRSSQLGEERIRPLHGTLYGIYQDKLVDLGLLDQRGVLDQVSRDWESFQHNYRPELPPRGLVLNILSDRHIIFHTEVATLWLGHDVFKVKRRTKLVGVEYIREAVEDWHPISAQTKGDTELEQVMSVSRERQIIDATSSKPVGSVKLNSGEKSPEDGVCSKVTVMVMSEAQYMGNETRVDVLGYPVYNIMMIEKKANGVWERAGLGKIYKFAWKRAGPKREVVILE